MCGVIGLYKTKPFVFLTLCTVFLAAGCILHILCSLYYLIVSFKTGDDYFLMVAIGGFFLPIIIEIALSIKLLLSGETVLFANILIIYLFLASVFVWFVFRPFKLWYYYSDDCRGSADPYCRFASKVFRCYDCILTYVAKQFSLVLLAFPLFLIFGCIYLLFCFIGAV